MQFILVRKREFRNGIRNKESGEKYKRLVRSEPATFRKRGMLYRFSYISGLYIIIYTPEGGEEQSRSYADI